MTAAAARRAYMELAGAVELEGVPVVDASIVRGVCVDLPAGRNRRSRRAIVVGCASSWKERLFVLAHEVGHAFYVKRFGPLVARRRLAPEAWADRAGRVLVAEHSEELAREYDRFVDRNKAESSGPAHSDSYKGGRK